MSLSPEISELCKRSKITEYLANRGVTFVTAGGRSRCCCPLPDHDDSTPSFYIYTSSDGAEMFKCFGCGTAGNIITLIHLVEKKAKKDIVKALAKSTGVTLGKFDPATRLEPSNDEVVSCFCDVDQMVSLISVACLQFIHANGGSEDAVNKISRVYQILDDFSKYGQGEHVKDKWGVNSLYDVMAYVWALGAKYKDKPEASGGLH
jgi:DNA primase